MPVEITGNEPGCICTAFRRGLNKNLRPASMRGGVSPNRILEGTNISCELPTRARRENRLSAAVFTEAGEKVQMKRDLPPAMMWTNTECISVDVSFYLRFSPYSDLIVTS